MVALALVATPSILDDIAPPAPDGLLPLHVVQFADPVVPATALGVPGKLKWLQVASLYVDPRYQRPITASGRKTIWQIVHRFNWALFSPLIVAYRGQGPDGKDRYAIIDGQHRATGAKTHGGIFEVPCLIITGGPEVEARAFAIINGQVTGVLPTQIHAARVMAKEPDAIAIDDACKAAGVRVLKSGNGAGGMKPGDTMAIATLEKCLKRYGRDTLITALQCVTETGNGNPGELGQTSINGLCAVLDANRVARDAGEALFAAVEAHGGITVMLHRARVASAADRVAVRTHFINQVKDALHLAALGKEEAK